MSCYTPRPYQRLITNYILDNPRCQVFASPGVGKTSSTLDAVASLLLFGMVKRVLVLAPKRVAVSAWTGELEKWSASFGHLTMAVAVGTPKQRLDAVKSGAVIVCMGYEGIEWLVETFGGRLADFDMVVADEAPRLKALRISLQQRTRKDGSQGKRFIAGQGGKRAKALAKVAHTQVKRWVSLTGSPASNGLQDLWPIVWYIDGGQRLGNSFTAFTNRWFRTKPGTDPMHRQIEPMPFAQEQIQNAIKDCTIRIDAKDWFDLTQPIERNILVELPAEARKQYRELQTDFFTYIKDHPVEATAAGAKMQKLLQVASGTCIVNEQREWVVVHDEKLEALKSLITELNGENVLIAYQFRADRERILKAFPKFKTLDHKGAEEDFKTGHLPGLLVHPASAGHGLSLQAHCSILIDYSTGINLEFDEQVFERIGSTRQAQIGSTRAVYRYRIVAAGTVEQTVNLPRLKSKASLQDAVNDAMKVA